MKEPVFILGCPRSGTTLLAGLLRNTSFGAPVESHFITKYFKKLDKYGNFKDKKNLTRLLNDILKERPVMQWKLQIDVDKFYKELEDLSYAQIVDKICLTRAERKGYKSWGDKTPHYTLDVDIIYKLFPKSKYIYIVRDGRDVAFSLLGRQWGPKNIFTCAEYWRKYNSRNVTMEKLKSLGQLYYTRYEDLLDNAEQILPDIYSFLDEPYDEDKMSNVIGRIRKGNYNKWKKLSSSHQVRLFESIAADTLKRFGYETSYEEKDTNSVVVSFYRFHNSLKAAIFLFKLNVIDTLKIKFFGKQPFAE